VNFVKTKEMIMAPIVPLSMNTGYVKVKQVNLSKILGLLGRKLSWASHIQAILSEVAFLLRP